MNEIKLAIERELMDAASIFAASNSSNWLLPHKLMTHEVSKKSENWLRMLICFGNMPKAFVFRIKNAIRLVKQL